MTDDEPRHPLLLIAEDQPRDREALQPALVGFRVRNASTGDEARKALVDDEIDGLIADIQLPGMNGIELARRFWRYHPEKPVLFWTQHGDEMYLRALERDYPDRPYGFMLKDSTTDDLRTAIKAVFLHGQSWTDPRLKDVRRRATEPHYGISDAEFEVLVDIALGLTDRMIAERRYLTRRGVQNRLRSLYQKLGVDAEQFRAEGVGDAFNPRSRAVATALERGLLNSYEMKRANEALSDWLAKRSPDNEPENQS